MGKVWALALAGGGLKGLTILPASGRGGDKGRAGIGFPIRNRTGVDTGTISQLCV